MFMSVPPNVAVSALMQRVKGRSSHKIQLEFPAIRKRYWGRHFWARGYFCTTSGNITNDIILQYINQRAPTNLPTPVGSGLVMKDKVSRDYT